MSKRRYNADATRQDILDAGEQLFADQGFSEVSTNKIAKVAGVSQSQIHYHFKTKRKLWSAVFRRRFEQYFQVQSDTLVQFDVGDTQMMEESIRAYFTFFRRNPLFVKLLGRAQIDQIHEDEEPMCSELHRRGEEMIRKAQKAGILRDDIHPQFIILGFISLVAHWFQSREEYLKKCGLTDEPENYDDQYLEFILKVYLRGISP